MWARSTSETDLITNNGIIKRPKLGFILRSLLEVIEYTILNVRILELNVARPMYITLYHFIVLILIIHVLRYDTRQDNYCFIRKVIDKRTKIKSKSCRGGGLNLCSLKTSVFPELKILKILPPKPLGHGDP